MLSTSNIKNNPITTAIGLLIILTSVVGFFAFKDVGITEKLIGVGFGLGLLGIKDPSKK